MPQSTQRKDVVAQKQQEKESKRARGALSCAECRRCVQIVLHSFVSCASSWARGGWGNRLGSMYITGERARIKKRSQDLAYLLVPSCTVRSRGFGFSGSAGRSSFSFLSLILLPLNTTRLDTVQELTLFLVCVLDLS